MEQGAEMADASQAKRVDPMRDIEQLLEQWGRWVCAGRPGPGRYRCPLADLRSSGLPEPMIGDDEALAVDGAYGELVRDDGMRSTRRAEAIWCVYVRGIPSYVQVAKVMRLPTRFAARDLILAGEQWLAGRLQSRGRPH